MTLLFSPGCHVAAGNKHLAKVGSCPGLPEGSYIKGLGPSL